MFERNYSFFHHRRLFGRCVMFQKQYFKYRKPKYSRGHKQPLRVAWSSCSYGTAWNT